MNKHTKNSAQRKMHVSTDGRRRTPGERAGGPLAIGIDLGDRYSEVCVLDEEGNLHSETRIRTTDAGMQVAEKPAVSGSGPPVPSKRGAMRKQRRSVVTEERRSFRRNRRVRDGGAGFSATC